MIISFQGLGNGLNAVLAALVPPASQHLGIPLAVQDSLDNAHASHAGYLTYHVVQKQIHLAQGFLHVLDMCCAIAHLIHPLRNAHTCSGDSYAIAGGTGSQARRSSGREGTLRVKRSQASTQGRETSESQTVESSKRRSIPWQLL